MSNDVTFCAKQSCPLEKDCERKHPTNNKHGSMAEFSYHHDTEGQTVCHNFIQRRMK